MSEAANRRNARVLCLLRDGPSAATLRWTQALARDHAVELVDLSRPGVAYDQLIDRIFSADRVISW